MSGRETREPHVIIGAGIIGLMTAWHLQQAGRSVQIIDRLLPGDVSQTSYGNAGVLSFASYRPVAEPGIWKDGIQGLMNPDSVLRIPWSYLPEVTPWLWRFLKESRTEHAQSNAEAILALNLHSRTCWQRLIQAMKLQPLIEPTGWLKVFETDAAFQKQMAQTSMLDQAGLDWPALTGHDVRDLEPAIGTGIKHGFLQVDSLRVRQPHQLLQALARHLSEQGAEFIQARVQSLQIAERGLSVVTDRQTYENRHVSLCGGAYSQRLLATLGEQIPLETERGYHLMMETEEVLNRPIMHVEEQYVLSPMLEGLRMTSGEELAGLDAPADYALIHRQHNKLSTLLPGIATPINRHWLGFRPSLPDSKPIIGRHPTIKGLTMAFGHGHLGMTQSAATGDILSRIICGDSTGLDTTPYRFERFG